MDDFNDSLTKLLNETDDPLSADSWQRTALWLASALNKVDVIKGELQVASDDITTLLEQVDHDGWTALHAAAAHNSINAAKHLIEQNIQVNKESHNGDTALHLAAKNGSLEMVKILVQNGANVQALNNRKETILHAAICGKDATNKIEYLLEQGANPDHFSDDGMDIGAIISDMNENNKTKEALNEMIGKYYKKRKKGELDLGEIDEAIIRANASNAGLVLQDVWGQPRPTYLLDEGRYLQMLLPEKTHEAKAQLEKHRNNYIAAFSKKYQKMVGLLGYDPKTSEVRILLCPHKKADADLVVSHLVSMVNIRAPSKIQYYGSQEKVDKIIKMTSTKSYMFVGEAPSDDSTVLELHLKIEYTSDLAAKDHEKDPRLDFYLSSDVSTDVRRKWADDSGELTKGEIKLEFTLKGDSIPDDCLLNIAQFARHTNERGEWCWNQAGYTNMPLGTLLARKTVRSGLIIPNSSADIKSNTKATLMLTVVSHNVALEDTDDGGIKLLKRITSRLEHEENQIAEYIKTDQTFYENHPPTNPSVGKITVFVYRTGTGFVPGSMFDIFKVPASREEYYLNALSIAVARRNNISDVRKVNLLGDHWMKSKVSTQITIAMDMLCVYCTSCPYITDEADHNKRKGFSFGWSEKMVELIESFDIMRIRDAGDCEDGAREVLQEAMEIKHNFKAGKFKSKILARIAGHFDDFIFVSVLCGVSSQALANLPTYGSQSGNIKLNGHEAAFAIPKYMFYSALKARLSADHIILATAVEVGDDLKGKDQTVYVLESTGLLRPEPSKMSDSELHIMKKVHQVVEYMGSEAKAMMDNARVMYTYGPERKDNFYKMMIACLTPEFLLEWGIPHTEFLLCYIGEQEDTRGVWFRDLVNFDKRVCAIPAPAIPPNVMTAIGHICKDDQPLQPLHEPLPEHYEPDKYVVGTEVIGASHTIFIRMDNMTDQTLLLVKNIAVKAQLKMTIRKEPVRYDEFSKLVGNYAVTFY